MSSIARPSPTRLRLPTGRTVSYRVYGPVHGRPVFYFHGVGGNGAGPHLARWGSALGLRFAAPDRPGYGHSDFQHRRRIPDIAEDTAAIADHLGWSHFACLGVSGGGPYCLAAAWALPDRVNRALVVSGVGPRESPDAGFHPAAYRRYRSVLRLPHPLLVARLLPRQLLQAWVHARFAPQVVAGWASSPNLPPADRAAVRRPDVREPLVAVMQQTRARDARGLAWEMRLFMRSWGFSLQDIRVPVDFWVGSDDRSVSPAASRWMAERVGGSTLTELPDVGHALLFVHWREVLDPVVARP